MNRFFPEVFYLPKNTIPIRIFLDKSGKVIEEIFYEKAEDEDLLGLIVYDTIFIYPQSSLSKVITLFHEFIHWLNFKTFDLRRIDNFLDKWLK